MIGVQHKANLSTSIGNRLGNEDPIFPALRVPFPGSPPSVIGQLSKACSTKSAIIGKRQVLSSPDGYHTIGGIQ